MGIAPHIVGSGSRARAAALSTTVLLAAACARYVPAPIAPTVTAAALDARTLEAPRLRQFIATVTPEDNAGAVRPWDLTTLTLAALYYHPDLELRRARLATTRAAVLTAAQRPNPVLSLNPLRHLDVLTPSPWTVGLVVDLVIETFGKRGFRIAQAEQIAAAVRQDLATGAWLVRGRVRSALVALWAAQTRRTLFERRRALQEQLVNLLERRLAVGEASALDVTRERIVLAQISLAGRDADRQAAEARAALATAVGVPAEALAGVDLSLEAITRPADPLAAKAAVGAFRRAALIGRTDVQGLLAEYEAAQAALQLEIARQYPNLALGPGYTYDQADNQFGFGLSATLPVFHQNQGPIAEAEARRREAAARFLALQARVIGEIDRAVASYRAATRTLATADALRAAQRRRLEQVERAFRAGGVDRPTLVTAELELAAIDLSRFDAVVLQRQALELLEDALQRPLFDPSAAAFLPGPGGNPRPGVSGWPGSGS
jgi:cobalt-zinc-cadmium efflux system outer membrane protein